MKLYKFICYVVVFSGLGWIVRKIFARRKVTIILYHDPSPEIVEKHLSFLSGCYHFITLHELVAAIRNKHFDFPPYSMVITFDDGHRGNARLTNVFLRYGITPTIFLCSSIINCSRKFWFKLPGINSNAMKAKSNRERLRVLREEYGFDLAQQFPSEERQALNSDELDTMMQVFDFQSHTCFHPILTTCTMEEAEFEIVESKAVLSRDLKKEILHFAYPNGDYSDREMDILKAAGYDSARSTDVGWNDITTDPYRLKVTGVGDASDAIMLRAELSGIPGYLYNLMSGGIKRRSLRGEHVPESEK